MTKIRLHPYYIERVIRHHVVDVYIDGEVTSHEVHAVIRRVMCDHPELFWFAGGYRLDESCNTIHFQYLFSAEEAKAIQQHIDEVVRDDFNIEHVRVFLSPQEQADYVYRWLATHCRYDVGPEQSQTIYGALVSKKADSMGYAKAVQYLFKQLNIESRLVFGRLYHDVGTTCHCWNLVKLNGRFYHLDACCAFFCVSTDEISQTRSIDEQESLPSCEDSLLPKGKGGNAPKSVLEVGILPTPPSCPVCEAVPDNDGSSNAEECFPPFREALTYEPHCDSSSCSDEPDTESLQLADSLRVAENRLERELEILQDIRQRRDDIHRRAYMVDVRHSPALPMPQADEKETTQHWLSRFVEYMNGIFRSTSAVSSSDAAQEELQKRELEKRRQEEESRCRELEEQRDEKMKFQQMEVEHKRYVQDLKWQIEKIENRIYAMKEAEKYGTVYSSVFAPAEVKCRSHLQVQVYLHLHEETDMVKSLAVEADKRAERRGYVPLQMKLKQGDRVDVELNIYGETCLANFRKSVTWQGVFTKCSFDYFVAVTDVDELSCEANLYVNGALVGEMRFITQIKDMPRCLNPEILSHAFSKIFISYAHQDTEQVKSLALAYKAQGVDYFFDRDNLQGGDVYEEKIFEYIDASDLFILCWSKNAAQSDYVAKEKRRALQRAYPQLSRKEATLKIYPISIIPRAELPDDMKGIYNFEVM